MKYSKIIGLTIVSSTALLTACTDDLANIFNSEHEIVFEVKTTSANDTRATDSIPEIEPVKLTADNGETYYLHTDITPMPESIQPADTSVAVTRGATADATSLHDGFGVTAYNTDGTTEGSSYFLNSSTSYTTVSTTDVYTPTGAGSGKYWPKGKLNFYAYYPYTSAVTGTHSQDTHGLSRSADGKTIKYVVPSTPANQPDLMTAKLENQQYSSGDGRAALTFNHALCAISFKTGTDIAGGTINSITFNNVYTEGKYDISTGTWSDTSAGNLSFTGLSKSTTEGTSGTLILTDDNTLMMIPQDFTSDNQTITISFAVSGEATPKTLTYNLNGSSWTKGQSITYSITTDGLVWAYVLEATGGEIDYTGGNVTFNVKSYRYKRTTPSTIEALPWTVDGYKADGASTFSSSKPSWITSITTSGDGTATTSATNSGTATITAQTATTAAASFTSVERGTSNAPYDLSTKGGTTSCNTANCYVVNAPGWYKIPLVYGNGIKNGVNNTSAYNSSSFVDYNGTQIRNLSNGPYVKNSSGTLSNAVIVWQDANNLLDNVSYDTTSPGYIKFHVGTNMVEGNSLIAIRNSSNVIMWSWHIWVTAMDIAKSIPTKTSDNKRTYHMMPIPLGWVNVGTTTQYLNRKTEVKVKQAGTALTTTLIVNQNPYVFASQSGFATVYQWGRKDPQIPIDRSSIPSVNKAIFNGVIASFTAQEGPTTLSNVHRTPHIYYYASNYQWQNDRTLYDLWNVGNTSYGSGQDGTYPAPHQNVVKSVYDPNPYGYKIPPALAFTGISSANDYNTYGTYGNTNYSPSQKIFLPALGIRSYRGTSFDGSTGDDAYGSAFWSSLPIYPPGTGSSQGAIGADIAIYCNNGGANFSYVVPAANTWGYNVLPILESDE